MKSKSNHKKTTQRESFYINEPKPSYFAIITSDVRYCKELEPNAKLFFAEITALSGREGFCWASNKYFAELYDVDERTIKRWIESLKKHKFIHVEIIKDGMQTSRRIWLSAGNKKMFTKGQKCPPGGTKMSPPGDKNVPHNNTSNNIENIYTHTPVAPAPSVCNQKSSSKEEKKRIGSHVVFSESQVKKLKEKYGVDVFYEIVEDINDYCVNNRPKGYPDYEAAFRTFHKKQKSFSKNAGFSKKSQSYSQDNKKMIQETIKNNPGSEKVISVYSTHVEIQNGSPYPYTLDFKENGFLDQFRSFLKKSGHKLKWIDQIQKETGIG